MITQNINTNQGLLPVRFAFHDALAVAIESTPKTSQPQPSPEQLKQAVESINQAMRQSNQSVSFSVDANTKAPVIKMMDTETGKLIRQYPSEEVLAIAQSIDEYLNLHQLKQGLLLKQTA